MQKQTATEIASSKGFSSFLTKPGFAFVSALISGIAALAAAIIAIASNWSVIVFNSRVFTGLLSQYANQTGNSTAQQIAYYILGVEAGAKSLQSALFVFTPLLIIGGAFMIVAAMHLRSKDHDKLVIGGIFSVVFSSLVFIGLMAYVPFNSLAVSVLFSYLGNYSVSNGAFALSVFILFFVYFILGLMAGLSALYRRSMHSRD